MMGQGTKVSFWLRFPAQLIGGEYRFHGKDTVTLEVREPEITGLSLEVRALLKPPVTAKSFKLVEIDPETLSRE